MIDSLVNPVSTFAPEIDNLFWLITVVVGFWFLLAEGMFFYLIARYRYREGQAAQYVTGKEKHLKRWITIPHALIILCDVFLIVGAIRVWYMVKQDLPEADATVRVVGQQWAWSFQHPGLDGELDTEDDIYTVDELHVEVDKTYHAWLESRDVLHSFYIPVFRLKQDIVPGRRITAWFEATQTGTHDLICAEMCGIGHGIMGARIVIETAEEHEAWMKSHSPVAAN